MMTRCGSFMLNIARRHGGGSLRVFLSRTILLAVALTSALWLIAGCAGRANYMADPGFKSDTGSGGGVEYPADSVLKGSVPGSVVVLMPANYVFQSGAPALSPGRSPAQGHGHTFPVSGPEYALNQFDASVELSILPSDISYSLSGSKMRLNNVGDRTVTVLIPGWSKFVVNGCAGRQIGVKLKSIDTSAMRTVMEVYAPVGLSGTSFSRKAYQCQASTLISLLPDEPLKIRNEYGILVDTVTPHTAGELLAGVDETTVSFADVPPDVYQQYMTQDEDKTTVSPRVSYIYPPDKSVLPGGANEVTIRFTDVMDLTMPPEVRLGSRLVPMISYASNTWTGALDVPHDGSWDAMEQILTVSGARDLSGNIMIPSSSYTWTVAARDTEKPTVKAISPDSGSVLGAGKHEITVVFSELMNVAWPVSVKIGSRQLEQISYLGDIWKGQIIVPADGSWDATAEIMAVWGGRDLAGNVMDADDNVGFYSISSEGDTL